MRTPARRKEWFDDDHYWKRMYPIMFREERFAAAEADLDKVLALTGEPGNAVLDLCCGPGRFAVPLATRGYQVTGVDRSAFFLSKARARARKAGTRIECVRKDMRDFVRKESFDLALSMFTSFGYFENRQEDMLVLRNILASLKPDGVLLIEMMGKEILARTYTPTSSEVLSDGTIFIERRQILDGWTQIRNEWTLIKGSRAETFTLRLTTYSGQELRDRLEQAGFVDVKLYGSLEGGPYDHSARRLVITGTKPHRHRDKQSV